MYSCQKLHSTGDPFPGRYDETVATPTLSIIIPTHKRAKILAQCLEHIEKQTIVDQLEVIVVSDGPDEEVKWKVENGKWKMTVKFFEVSKSHQGVARNKGTENAGGEFILFIGDDIFLKPDACEKHLHALSSFHFPFSVLGHTTWDPACGITPVMKWLETSGWQFGYPMIKRYAHHFLPSHLQHRFTYTSNISLPTKIAKRFLFREDVKFYGWEDIEWGWRLRQAGIKLFYEPDAKALHHHHMTLDDSLRRMEILGRSAVVMDRLNLELNLVPRGSKRLKYQAASLLPSMRGRHSKAFLAGIDQ